MPLFFFHLRIGEHLDADTVGVDLPDLDAARTEAYSAMADLLWDAALTGQALLGEGFEIADQAGRPVLAVRFDAQVDTSRIG